MGETANENYICEVQIVRDREGEEDVRHTFGDRLNMIQHDNGCQINKNEVVTKT